MRNIGSNYRMPIGKNPLDTLDYWTEKYLETLWKEYVKETQGTQGTHNTETSAHDPLVDDTD